MNFCVGIYSTINANRAKERRTSYPSFDALLAFASSTAISRKRYAQGFSGFSWRRKVFSRWSQSRHIFYEHNRARNITRTRVTEKVSSQALCISFRIPCFDYNLLLRFQAIYTGICRVIIIKLVVEQTKLSQIRITDRIISNYSIQRNAVKAKFCE